jgi:transposase
LLAINAFHFTPSEFFYPSDALKYVGSVFQMHVDTFLPSDKDTKEFREEAVKLITEEKLSYPEAGRRLQLAPTTIMNWVKASKAGKLGEIGKNYRPLTEVEIELARTKKELATVKMECEMATFSLDHGNRRSGYGRENTRWYGRPDRVSHPGDGDTTCR